MTQSTMWIVFSLFMEFTITETFSYFGRLLHMTRDQVDYFQTLPNISNRLRADKRSFSNFSTFQKTIARCHSQKIKLTESR